MKMLFCTIALMGVVLAAADYDPWIPARITSLKYPALGLQAQIQGEVHLRVKVNARGAVAGVRVVSGAPVLAKAAQENIQLWKFTPSCGKQQAMEGEVDFTYIFKLKAGPVATPVTDFVYEHPRKVTVTSHPQHWLPAEIR
jgi:TonB family protein